MKNARARAALHLAPVLRQQSALNLDSIDPEDPDRGLISELCYGTLRFLPALEILAKHLLHKGLKEKDSDVLALLLIGLYQIRHLRVSDHAAVSETVQAAKQLKKPWATGLLNGALRTSLRELESLEKEFAKDRVFASAHPEWLINSIERQWPDQAEQIFAGGNSRPPMTLRANLHRTDRDSLVAELEQAGFAAGPGQICPSAVQLDSAIAVHRIPGFEQGLASVQDEGAQLAAYLLNPKNGDRVLDACAAPGGKTGHLLEYCSDISLLAMDIDQNRISRVEENLQRLNYTADIQVADASDPESWWSKQPFDCILLDAPCSGSGVIRRHPDIKHLRTPEDISGFRERQIKLLEALWSTLAEGGKLLYVTCSILKSENQDVVSHFAKGRNDLALLDMNIEGASDEFAARVFPCNPGIQLLPMAEGQDGFYYALMAKQSKV